MARVTNSAAARAPNDRKAFQVELCGKNLVAGRITNSSHAAIMTKVVQ